jgi:site-specific DNA-methyltransferase (cytosine-N4-specific)
MTKRKATTTVTEISPLLDTVQLTDALSLLKTLPDESIHSIITSPPYYAQRDYGSEAQIGLESHPDLYIKSLTEVFREARRVLRDDGTLWLNIGDNYVGATSQHKENGSQGKTSSYSRKHMNGVPKAGRKARNETFYEMGLPMKSLVGMPWRVAFALQNDGWILRCDIIWHRPAASESVKDRPTHAHEYIFMFSKKQRYYYDRSFMLTETGANIQSVWRVTGTPFTGAHCATFPPELIEPIVLASCPEKGVILDPFGGSGTIGLVSKQHNRHFILCEINPDIAELARKRVSEGITKKDKERLLEAEVKQEKLPLQTPKNPSKKKPTKKSLIDTANGETLPQLARASKKKNTKKARIDPITEPIPELPF